MHIPLLGQKTIDHDVKDFAALLNLNWNWTKRGAEVPDILEIGSTSEFDENSPLED
jgi:hypothetical protein